MEAFATQAKEQAAFEELLRNRALLVDHLDNISGAGEIYHAQPDDVALIQFSSGSTSEPKGVMLTHRNIIANGLGVTERAGLSEEDVSLSWMPLTHDMGLIGFHICVFANRGQVNLMSTELFMRRPLLWLTLAMREARDHPLLAKFRIPPLSESARRPPDRRAGSLICSPDI